MFGPTKEEIEYCKKFEEYMECFHDYETEDKLNNNELNIDIYFPKKIFEYSKLDFEHEYVYMRNLDEIYGNTTLRYLFENGYNFCFINKESNLYRICKEVKNHIIHSPYKNFKNNTKIFILKKDNLLFYVSGTSYRQNICVTYISYLGIIGQKTKRQTTIFDYIKE